MNAGPPEPEDPQTGEILATAEQTARKVLRSEAAALLVLAEGALFGVSEAVGLMLGATANGMLIVTTGLGKSAFVARRLASSLTALGAPAVFLHPADALHGDLGLIAPAGVLVAVSKSGDTPEVLQIALATLPTPIVAVTEGGRLAQIAAHGGCVVRLPDLGEANNALPLPSVSAALQGAMCDALALALADQLPGATRFFRTVHPGGALGKRFAQ